MKPVTRPQFHDSEISKTSDFELSASHPVFMIGSFMDGSAMDCQNSFIVSGLEVVQRSPASMNVAVKAGLGFSKADSKPLFLASDAIVAVSASNASQARIDLIEARYSEVDEDMESRSFKDSANGNISYLNIPTKKGITVEFKCLAGALGSGSAPELEPGWVKLAEIHVAAGSVAIYDDNIFPVNADSDGVENTGWTDDLVSTFRQGSVNQFKELFKAHESSVPTIAESVHGIIQGHTGGFNADMVDGIHGRVNGSVHSNSFSGSLYNEIQPSVLIVGNKLRPSGGFFVDANWCIASTIERTAIDEITINYISPLGSGSIVLTEFGLSPSVISMSW